MNNFVSVGISFIALGVTVAGKGQVVGGLEDHDPFFGGTNSSGSELVNKVREILVIILIVILTAALTYGLVYLYRRSKKNASKSSRSKKDKSSTGFSIFTNEEDTNATQNR